MPKVIYMDLARCIDCRACEVACEREHGGFANIHVALIEERYAIPLNCHHCETSFCTLVCPTQAIHRETYDAVVISAMKCIGCGLCSLACPFGSIFLDLANKIARKCDLCLDKTRLGLDPACVSTCSARALAFGEFEHMLARGQQRSRKPFILRSAGNFGTVVTLPNGSKDLFSKRGQP